MRLIRSPQFAAGALIIAAVLGLLAANGPLAQAIGRLTSIQLTAGPVQLSVEHWITDGLLAIFFFIAALELKHELVAGELTTPAKALVPAAAALGGVLAPAGIYLLLLHDPELRDGWPIPTATDIAFALGVLAIVGRALPRRVRALLLALAVIDDLIAILIIAVFFAHDVKPLLLLAAVAVVAVFGLLSRRKGAVIVVLCTILGVAAWVLVVLSGIHATVAGVALGLVFASGNNHAVRHALEPWSNAIILPLFAFVATLVRIPDLAATPLGPVFWTILVALPVGKIVGITAGASLAARLGRSAVPLGDLLVVAALGGIGFTVSLLMNELAFAGSPEHQTEGTLGVLAASLVAIVLGGGAAIIRGRHYARAPRG
ncbi:Na+/H+ antiporter NhaA [soil metagenome]